MYGRCECLQGIDDCVEYPIYCESTNPDLGGDDSCSATLPNSVCDKDKNWYVYGFFLPKFK